MNEPYIEKAVLSCIGDRFISHCTNAEWGFSILIMERDGKAFGRLYQYNDDRTVVYFDWLSVDAEFQGQRIGTELLEMHEKIGVYLGAATSCLWVHKDTWMHEWYKRRNYEDWQDNENEVNAIWMKKTLT